MVHEIIVAVLRGHLRLFTAVRLAGKQRCLNTARCYIPLGMTGLISVQRLLPRNAGTRYTTTVSQVQSGTYNPKKYLAQRRNNPELRQKALADAAKIASFLFQRCGAKVYGIGSAFEGDRDFSIHSDIDLVAEGIPAHIFVRLSAEAAFLTDFHLDLIPFENANELLRETVHTRGVPL
jgi:predicted nucleotidyltransferase